MVKMHNNKGYTFAYFNFWLIIVLSRSCCNKKVTRFYYFQTSNMRNQGLNIDMKHFAISQSHERKVILHHLIIFVLEQVVR